MNVYANTYMLHVCIFVYILSYFRTSELLLRNLIFCIADTLLGDLLVAENSQFQSDINSPVSPSERPLMTTSPRSNNALSPFSSTSTPDDRPEAPSSGFFGSVFKSV